MRSVYIFNKTTQNKRVPQKKKYRSYAVYGFYGFILVHNLHVTRGFLSTFYTALIDNTAYGFIKRSINPK